MDEEKVHFTKHFTKEGREMSRYYTLVQGKQTGLRSNWPHRAMQN